MFLAAAMPGTEVEDLKTPALRRSQADRHQEWHTYWIIARWAGKIRVASGEVDRHPLPRRLDPRQIMRLAPASQGFGFAEIERWKSH
jgi:hypothetical protein